MTRRPGCLPFNRSWHRWIAIPSTRALIRHHHRRRHPSRPSSPVLAAIDVGMQEFTLAVVKRRRCFAKRVKSSCSCTRCWGPEKLQPPTTTGAAIAALIGGKFSPQNFQGYCFTAPLCTFDFSLKTLLYWCGPDRSESENHFIAFT